MTTALGVIPARFDSSRFPGKPLAPLENETLIERVWRRTVACSALSRVIVATDDGRILREAQRIGADHMLTSADHASGTDRVAEVVRRLGGAFDVVVNVQGDEPLVTASSLAALIGAFAKPDPPEIATLWEPITDPAEVLDPNVVKVVADGTGRALYFSRAPIPYHHAAGAVYRKHQGIYAYRPAALLALADMPLSPLEKREKLEQLRALEAGFTIVVIESDFRSHGVDTPQDLERVRRRLGEAVNATPE